MDLKLPDLMDRCFPFDEYRPNQKAILKVLADAYRARLQHVILEAPTGSGKSVIAYTIGKYLTEIGEIKEGQPPIIVCTRTRVLQEQYAKTFPDARVLWSAAHYNCALIPMDEDFYYGSPMCLKKICPKLDMCEYLMAREEFYNAPIGILNYNFYFLSKRLRPQLVVWDESHLVDQVLSDVLSVLLSYRTINRVLDSASDYSHNLVDMVRDVIDLYGKLFKMDTIDDQFKGCMGNIAGALRTLYFHLDSTLEAATKGAEIYDRGAHRRLAKSTTTVGNLYERVRKFCNSEFDWVIANTDEQVMKLRPLEIQGEAMTFIGKTKHNLLMSATICLTGDTKIRLMNGTDISAEEWYSTGDLRWIYSADKNGRIDPALAEIVLSGYRDKLVEVTLDNGESFRCTPEHPLITSDGLEIEASSSFGMSLMPLYIRPIGEDGNPWYVGRPEIFLNDKKQWEPLHCYLGDVLSLYGNGKSMIHHKDGNEWNNEPPNLQGVTNQEHVLIHATSDQMRYVGSFKTSDQRSETLRKQWEDPDFSASVRSSASKNLSIFLNENRQFNSDRCSKMNNDEVVKTKQLLGRCRKVVNALRVIGFDIDKNSYSVVRRSFPHSNQIPSWETMEYMLNELGTDLNSYFKNHVVVEIREIALESPQPVYDLRVHHPNHNFALSCGVFVHNCGHQALAQSLGLEEYYYEEVPSTIPVDNRLVYYMPIGSVNYSNKEVLFEQMVPVIDQIIDSIREQHGPSRGIIHSVSYDNAEFFKAKSRHGDRMVIPRNNMDINGIMIKWDDTILVSPAILEGVDLVDDISRWQIFPKVPYASLGDPWVKAKLDKDPTWYARDAVIKIVQGSGRSVRGEEDWAYTFILDAAFGRLLKNNRNLFPKWYLEAIREVG